MAGGKTGNGNYFHFLGTGSADRSLSRSRQSAKPESAANTRWPGEPVGVFDNKVIDLHLMVAISSY